MLGPVGGRSRADQDSTRVRSGHALGAHGVRDHGGSGSRARVPALRSGTVQGAALYRAGRSRCSGPWAVPLPGATSLDNTRIPRSMGRPAGHAERRRNCNLSPGIPRPTRQRPVATPIPAGRLDRIRPDTPDADAVEPPEFKSRFGVVDGPMGGRSHRQQCLDVAAGEPARPFRNQAPAPRRGRNNSPAGADQFECRSGRCRPWRARLETSTGAGHERRRCALEVPRRLQATSRDGGRGVACRP